MKILKKYIIILVVGLIVVACNEDIVREPSPVTNPNSTNVYFSNSNNASPILAKDSTSFRVIIERQKSDKAQTVKLSIESAYDDKVFQVPPTVSFAAGESSKTIKIPVQMELMKKYHIAILIDGADTNPYAIQTVYSRIDLNILKEDYAAYSNGTYTSGMFKSSWPQVLQYSPSKKSYRFKDLFNEGYDYEFSVSDDGTIVQVPQTAILTGYVHPTYGMVSAQAQDGSMFDKNSTYTFLLQFTVSAGSFGIKTEKYVITNKL